MTCNTSAVAVCCSSASRQFNGALLQRPFAIGNACDEDPRRRRDLSDLVGSVDRHFGRTPLDLRAHVLLYPLEACDSRAPVVGEDRHPDEHAQRRGDNYQEVEIERISNSGLRSGR